MAGIIGRRLSRLAVIAGVAVGVTGLAAVTLLFMPMGAPQAAGLTIPYAYVTNSSSNAVSVVKTSNNTVVNTMKVGKGPSGVAIT